MSGRPGGGAGVTGASVTCRARRSGTAHLPGRTRRPSCPTRSRSTDYIPLVPSAADHRSSTSQHQSLIASLSAGGALVGNTTAPAGFHAKCKFCLSLEIGRRVGGIHSAHRCMPCADTRLVRLTGMHSSVLSGHLGDGDRPEASAAQLRHGGMGNNASGVSTSVSSSPASMPSCKRPFSHR